MPEVLPKAGITATEFKSGKTDKTSASNPPHHQTIQPAILTDKSEAERKTTAQAANFGAGGKTGRNNQTQQGRALPQAYRHGTPKGKYAAP